MISNAYSVFDTKSLLFNLPFFAVNDGSAIRSFMDLANDANTTVGRHPSDFVLYHVGHYDDATGGVQPIAPLRHVIDAIALVHKQSDLPFPELAGDQQQRELNGGGK